MDVSNDTEGKCATVVLADKDGQYVATILKYSCDIAMDGGVTLAETPSEIDFVDTHNGEDASTSSIRRPSQLFEQKPGTDVVVIAEAYPPSGREVTTMDVMLRMGPVRKIVRLHGFRVWQLAAFGGLTAGPAVPIRVPKKLEMLERVLVSEKEIL